VQSRHLMSALATLVTVAALAATPALAMAESSSETPNPNARLVPTGPGAGTGTTPGQRVNPAGSYTSCPSSAFCMWKDAYFGGTQWTYSINSYPQNTWFYVGSGANDQASSFYNHRVHSTYINQNYPANGGQACIPSEIIYENLFELAWGGGYGGNANDSISAIYLANWNPC
jgi:hypothetical protein